jgi:two-component system OmpR family response regulator
MKVLVIEDDAETGAYIRKGLMEHGHVVELATNGRDGLFHAADETYDVMIVDRMLPGLDGFSVVKTLRVTGAKTPVLFLTTMSGVGDRVEGLQAGGDDYLVKPFAFAELLGTGRGAGAAAPTGPGGYRPARAGSRDGPDQPKGAARRAGDRSAAARISTP